MRKNSDPKLQRLAALPMFAPCSTSTLQQVAKLLDECTFQAGEDMIVEGKPGRAFFVIESGTAEVKVHGRPVATLGAGDPVGEMALLDMLPRTATVSARDRVTAFVASVQSFQTLIENHPFISRALLQMMSLRLRHAIEAVDAP